MAEIDVDGVVAGGTGTDQKRHGTHKEHFSQLAEKFRELEEVGAADGARFKTLCFTLLKSFEGVRIEQDAQVRDYEAKIAFCRATQRSCSMFSNLLVGMIATQVQEAKTAAPVGGNGATSPPGTLADGTVRMTEEERFAIICRCACVDDEDAADCDCSCHKGLPCDREDCVVCRAKEAQLKAERASETAGRRQPPTPATRKATKKKTTKKRASRKKSTTKKDT